jgi:hypothetical protein
MDAKAEKKTYKITRYALYMIGAILVTMLLKVGSNWILNLNPPYVGFGDFLLAIIVAMLLGYIGMTTIAWIRTDLVKRMKIEGKEVIAADGSLIGKIAGVDAKEEKIIVQTILEKRFNLPFSSIITIDDKVVVKVES